MGQVKYTPKQQMVIDTRNSNLLVSAAAGSGKTAVLTSRILSLISDKEHPIDIDHMLIVTFTKAAAAEMRERIGKLIEEYLEEHPEDVNMQKQHTLLHNAQITTIDSFCLYVIKNNFSDIDLDPGFRPMDEGEGQLMKQDILNEILEEHYDALSKGEDDEFGHLVDCYSEQGKDGELMKQILNIYQLAMSNPFPEDWLETCVKDYEVYSPEELYQQKWWQEGMKLSELLLQDAYQQAAKGVEICQEDGGPLAYLAALQAQKDYAQMLLDTGDYAARFRILHQMEIPAFGRVGKKDLVDEERKAKATECRDQCKKIFADLQEKFYIYPPKKLLEHHQYIGRAAKEISCLVTEFTKRFQEKKRQMNLIDFSDMEHLALQILLHKDAEGNVVPTETAKDYQEYFAQVMVDEYQDSNYVQEYILKSVSNGSDYFMVGDVKQSIYRFRLAQPEIFLGKYETFEENGDNIRIDLNQNFRCRKEVIDCVNEVFEQIMIPAIAGMTYDEKAKLYLGASYPDREDKTCDTELLLLEQSDVLAENAENKKGRKPEVLSEEAEEDSEEKVSLQEAEAKLITGKICSMFENHMQITDKKTGQLRPIRYKDIVILVRSAGKFAEVIRKSLEANGIPAYLTAKSGYFETQEIRTILNYLSVIDNPRQDIPLYGSLSSFFGGLTEEEMAMLRSGHQKECLWDTIHGFLQQNPEPDKTEISRIKSKLENFLKTMHQYQDMSVYTTIHDLLRIIFDESGYLNYMTALPGGLRRQANLYMLLEKASAFEQSSYHGLFQFIRYIGQLREQEVDYGEAGILDENADVVRIMTIHKSKGLEFPVCIIAGIGRKINKKDASKSILTDASMGLGLDYINPVRRRKMSGSKKKIMAELILREGLAEEMRVLYVAMTRAKEKLIMTGSCKNAEDFLCGLSEKVVPGKLLRANSYLELILSGLKAAGTLQNYVKVLTLKDITGEAVEREIKELYYEASLDREAERDSELYKRLFKQMEFSYAYPKLKGLYTKTSVSELKKVAYEDAQARPMFEESKADAYIPSFVQEEKELITGARRGTAYHRLMELLPFGVLQEKESNLTAFLKDVLNEKIKSGYIREEDAELISLEKCAAFLKTDMAKHMCEAAKKNLLYKEKSFFLGVPAREIKENFPEEEYILVQGVIDAYYEEEDGIVILDYKTDKVRKPDELITKYQKQLDIYARAVSQITGKRIKAKKIYSFVLEQEITIPCE